MYDFDFVAGDEVHCDKKGLGVIRRINSLEGCYPVEVEFKDNSVEFYTIDGKLYVMDNKPSLAYLVAAT